MRNRSLRQYIDGGIASLEGFANLQGNRNLTQRAGSAASSASGS
ncbi:hypothetical protein [Glutamicibacter ardleyensis]|nr:hypothetical protein [Glutamicibacter ardleyensis]